MTEEVLNKTNNFQNCFCSFPSHLVLGENAVHPLGEGFLLDRHPLLLQLPDPSCSVLFSLHPDWLRTNRESVKQAEKEQNPDLFIQIYKSPNTMEQFTMINHQKTMFQCLMNSNIGFKNVC